MKRNKKLGGVVLAVVTAALMLAALRKLQKGETLRLSLDSSTTDISEDLLQALYGTAGNVELNLSNTGITSIGDNAFKVCSSLASITYTGTKADWNNKITSFGIFWKYGVPATGVTCSDGKYAWQTSYSDKLGNPL